MSKFGLRFYHGVSAWGGRKAQLDRSLRRLPLWWKPQGTYIVLWIIEDHSQVNPRLELTSIWPWSAAEKRLRRLCHPASVLFVVMYIDVSEVDTLNSSVSPLLTHEGLCYVYTGQTDNSSKGNVKGWSLKKKKGITTAALSLWLESRWLI